MANNSFWSKCKLFLKRIVFLETYYLQIYDSVFNSYIGQASYGGVTDHSLKWYPHLIEWDKCKYWVSVKSFKEKGSDT